MIVAVIISFVIFNADSFGMIKNDLGALFGTSGLPFISAETVYYLKSYTVVFAVALFGATPLCKKLCEKIEGKKGVGILTAISICVILIVSTAYLVDGSFNPFLYFRF